MTPLAHVAAPPRLAIEILGSAVRVFFRGQEVVSLNRRFRHWGDRARYTRRVREVVGAAMRGHVAPLLPVAVLIARVAPRRLDTDNFIGSPTTKAFRDSISSWLCVDDGDETAVTWIYEQNTVLGFAVDYGLRPPRAGVFIQIQHREAP